MKKRLLTAIIAIAISIPTLVYAIEYLWTDKKGGRIFDCGGIVIGGKARIKEIGRNRYRVKGALINREVTARSIIHAAQIACGIVPEFEEKTSEEEEKN